MRPSRYHHVADTVRQIGAKRLIEVGTWRGDRAIEMMAAASERPGRVCYHGFDLFEHMTESVAKAEFHVKENVSLEAVHSRLSAWAKTATVLVDVILHTGDTRETLPIFASMYSPFRTFDFAWIDGGHSIETIRGDWTACRRLIKSGGVILLDDFYTGEAANPYRGANTLVDEIRREGLRVDIFPEIDPVKGGGGVQITKVELW
jgi:predicted O-methyltransferase YrrM